MEALKCPLCARGILVSVASPGTTSSSSSFTDSIIACNECSHCPSDRELNSLRARGDEAHDEFDRGSSLLAPLIAAAEHPLSEASAKQLRQAVAHLEKVLELRRATQHPMALSIGTRILFLKQ